MLQSPALEQPNSLLAPYDKHLFVEHDGWIGLRQILDTRGAGSYGLSGPRGAGKTWVMERALEVTKERRGLGVWFPSPSEYEPVAFLSALSDHVAIAFEELHDEVTERSTRASRFRFYRRAMGGVLLVYFSAALFVLANFGGPEGNGFNGLLNLGNAVLLFLFVAGFLSATNALRRRREDREGLGLVRTKAEELRTQVRYTETSTQSNERSLGGKYGALSGLIRQAQERQMVERPATLSSLIHNFRAFVQMVARELHGPVVIAIDELDKMSDATRVAQLLRDIKGIFEIQGACFLVSLSDEAAQALELGAVRARNEFNSSFYTVISMPPTTPAGALELLRMRDSGFDQECGRAIGILTGGVSREVVRVAELVRLRVGITPSLNETVEVAMGEELSAFSSWALQTANARGNLASLGDEARIALFDAVEEAGSAITEGGDEIRATVDSNWDLNPQNAIWQEEFSEEWRRLLVRLAVTGKMLCNPTVLRNEVEALRLQRVIQVAAESAAVGRRLLETEASLP
jgi:hypothetical protein